MKGSKLKPFSALLGVFLVGALLGFMCVRIWPASSKLPVPVEVRLNTTPQYPLIDPLIFTETDQSLFPELNPLDKTIDSYVAAVEADRDASSVSVYFRDLNTGHWTGTNEDEIYEPSSMLKVAVMIAYLRDSIQDKTILTKKLYYPGTDTSGQYYVPTDSVPAGYYSAQDLIKYMIVNSDNTAMNVLIKNNSDQALAVYHDFKLPTPPSSEVVDFMTADSYSTIFRTLYNASYLLRSGSEQALELLTKTTFTRGLVAGVPTGTVVAHKFGEHTYIQQDGTVVNRELHDCGIVYYPDKPYLLCVMTKGQDFPRLESVISGISKVVYGYIDAATQKGK